MLPASHRAVRIPRNASSETSARTSREARIHRLSLFRRFRPASRRIIGAALLTVSTAVGATNADGLRNGGFESPALNAGATEPFFRLTDRANNPVAWEAPAAPARIEWVRPGADGKSLPPAPEGSQYAAIREHPSDRPMILNQPVDVEAATSAGAGTYELAFRVGRPNDEPMALCSALIILLEPGSDKPRTSTGTPIIGTVDPGAFAERTVRFTIPPEARQDRFFVRFVVRGTEQWMGLSNPPGEQRMLIDDVRLRPVYQ